MDLLLSVREFLDAWKDGDRDDVLRTVTPEFAEALRPLPPAYLNRLTQQVVGKQKTGKRLQPRAQLDENTAHIRLPIAVGELWLTAKRADGHWLVDEVEVNSREEKEAVPSTRQLAQSLTQRRRSLPHITWGTSHACNRSARQSFSAAASHPRTCRM